MTCHHLSQEGRYQIRAFRKANYSIRRIAERLGRHPSASGRELHRDSNRKGCRPRMAHHLAGARAQQARSRPGITAKQWPGISKLLEQERGPQQIARRARHENSLKISHTWICRHEKKLFLSIYSDVYGQSDPGLWSGQADNRLHAVVHRLRICCCLA